MAYRKLGVDKEDGIVEIEGKRIEIEKKNIATAKTVVDF